MKKLLAVSMFVLLVLTVTQQARATFAIDPNPSGDKLFIDVANSNVASFTGHVDSELVTVTTTGNVDTGSGFATIKPIKDGTLTTLTFTPFDPAVFGDFDFRGQLLAAGDITVTVTDQGNLSQTFTFSIAQANQDFDAVGIISSDGETIKTVEISNAGFKEVKQIEFSLQNGGGPGVGVPEPGTLLLLGFGLVGLVGVARRRMK